jgi:hypothetical protein
MKPKHRFPALAALVFASAVWTCQSIAATIDKADNTDNLTLAQGAQTWNVASGRTLTLDTGTFSRSAGSTLNLQGTGSVSSSTTCLSNVNSITHP